MKLLSCFFFIIMLFISGRLYCQTITYEEIAGNWYSPDTTRQKILFKFINASDLIIQDAANNKTIYNYKLVKDGSHADETVLLVKSKTTGKNISFNYSIEKISNNILRLVSLDFYDVIEINDSHAGKDIIYLVKKN